MSPTSPALLMTPFRSQDGCPVDLRSLHLSILLSTSTWRHTRQVEGCFQIFLMGVRAPAFCTSQQLASNSIAPHRLHDRSIIRTLRKQLCLLHRTSIRRNSQSPTLALMFQCSTSPLVLNSGVAHLWALTSTALTTASLPWTSFIRSQVAVMTRAVLEH